MTFHKEYVLDADIYEEGTMSAEQMDRVMRGLMDAQLDIIKYQMNRPKLIVEGLEESS